MGSGGVGGFFGAKLAKGGADVHFVARGSHLKAMREQGLAIESTDPSQSLHLPKVSVTDDPATIPGPVDMVMFAVKLWDTESAARQLLPIMGPETGIISFQNGVQKDDMLRPVFGDKALMGGVAYVGTAIGRPGVIAQTGPLNRLVFGEYDGRRSKRAEDFLAACLAGGINAELSDDVRRSIWEKYVVLVAMSGATTAMRHTIGPIRTNPLTREFLLDLAREVVAVGRAHGVKLPADFTEQRIPFFDGWPPRDDDLDAPRPAGRPPARGALAVGRRGRTRQAGRRADADEPRGARHPHAAGRRQAGRHGALSDDPSTCM